MKLYCTTYIDDEQPEHLARRQHWSGTQKEAGAVRKDLKAQMFRNINTVEVNVPTDKPGLIAYLNALEQPS